MLEQRDLEQIAEIVGKALQPIAEKQDILGRELSELKQDAAVLKEDVVGLKQDVAVLKEDAARLKDDVSGLKDDVSGLQQDMSEVQGQLRNVDCRLKRVQVTLENETNKSIQFVAEGHQNLDRKLNEAIKLSRDSLSYTESFHLREIYFECELSMLKERVRRLEEYACRTQTA